MRKAGRRHTLLVRAAFKELLTALGGLLTPSLSIPVSIDPHLYLSRGQAVAMACLQLTKPDSEAQEVM